MKNYLNEYLKRSFGVFKGTKRHGYGGVSKMKDLLLIIWHNGWASSSRYVLKAEAYDVKMESKIRTKQKQIILYFKINRTFNNTNGKKKILCN